MATWRSRTSRTTIMAAPQQRGTALEAEDGRPTLYNFLFSLPSNSSAVESVSHTDWNWTSAFRSGSSCGQGQEEVREDDYVDYLDEEALELVQFQPAVDEEESWTPCDTINIFIRKNFNHPQQGMELWRTTLNLTLRLSLLQSLMRMQRNRLKDQARNPLWGGEAFVLSSKADIGHGRTPDLLMGRPTQPWCY